MQEISTGNTNTTTLAVQAAKQVFDRPHADPFYEPANSTDAETAVRHLGELFAELPGSAALALEAARESGTLISGDRLQGLAEIVQNADDVDASEVRLLLRPTDLLVSHNGGQVRLRHVLGFATPWLSTKAGDATTIGRFGIGLSTLRSLSTRLEVHCAPYHVRIGDPTLSPVEAPDLPPMFCERGWTTFRIPLQAETLQPTDLEEWLKRWDDSALLFLRRVSRVTLLDNDGGTIFQLALARRAAHNMDLGQYGEVSRDLVEAADGRSWMVYSTEVPVPTGVTRAQKATGLTTPIAAALPLFAAGSGETYAGLPVAPTRLPFFTNAQFDPLTSRTDFADTPWNASLVPLVAKLWSQAVLDLFELDPQAAWHAIPLPNGRDQDAASGVTRALEAAVLENARTAVASRLSFQVPGQGHVGLSHLAVEALPLEGVLQESETAKLAGLSATLPIAVRDQDGRWRLVLDDWRQHGADLSEPVSVEHALDLVGDEARPVASTIALVAAGLEAGLASDLLELPCVVAEDGRHLVPPAGASPVAVSVGSTPLADELGITTILHPSYRADVRGAHEVLDWLQECGALLDGSDDVEVVRRLASAGRAGQRLPSALTDEQVQALRDAFELIGRNARASLGRGVGRAVPLECYRYDAQGQKEVISARPVDSYLPRAIERGTDSFAMAAGESTGLVWLSERYMQVLRSPAGRGGIGALQFLRLLGAETAPRLRRHRLLQRRYQSEDRLGLPLSVPAGPASRVQAMRERGAEFTLEDRASPDLVIVAHDIAQEESAVRRRARASALLAALGRAWERRLSEFAEVDSADAYRGWIPKGKIRAFWLAQAGSLRWLDDEGGTPRRPAELLVRAPGNEAMYGAGSPNYLHSDLDQSTRRPVLTALGVSVEPSRSELVGRLRELRDESYEQETAAEDLRHDVARVYRALTRTLSGTPTDSDLNARQLRTEFGRGSGLVLTNLGWQTPRSSLAGPPIFGDLRAFAPAITGCEPLWRALELKEPSPDECLEVLREVARRREAAPDTHEEPILLETLRMLVRHYARGDTLDRRKLASLALWTSKGWMRQRPVYASDDPVLANGLGNRIPVWLPGGVLGQFRSLLTPLRVTEIRASEAEVIDPDLADADPALTERFQQAAELLRDDLLRNDSELEESLTVPWAKLTDFVVRVHPGLALRVGVDSGEEYDCEVNAKVDTTRAAVFVKEPAALAHMDGGGRALAALFEGNARHVALAWLAACNLAEDGIRARGVELARERAEREEAELNTDSRLAAFRERTASKRRSSGEGRGRAAGTGQPAQRKRSPTASPPRSLVDPRSLTLMDPQGSMEDGKPRTADGTHPTSRRGGLKEPKLGSRGPRNRAPLRGYSDLDREEVGFDLLKKLLASGDDRIADLRNQHGVGADAIDDLRQYYELKVHAGAEPDEVTLTASEVERARTTGKFFLVVVSDVEGVDARPKLRVIVDPLDTLQTTERGSIALSGVRTATSLVYHFGPPDDARVIGEEEA